MGIFSKLFGHKNEEKVGGMEDYMTLVRVYFIGSLGFSIRYHQFGNASGPSCFQKYASMFLQSIIV